jgi:hypothetical protein
MCHWILLLVLPYCSDPDVSGTPSLTTRPAAGLVAPAHHSVQLLQSSVVATDLDSILRGWEAAATEQPALSVSQSENLNWNVTKNLNGHAAIAAAKFQGTFEARQLKNQFELKLLEQPDDRVCVEAIPRDTTEQLFYGSIRVWLNARTLKLDELQVTDRQGAVRVNWPAPANSSIAPVSYVELVEGIPPSPATTDAAAVQAGLNDAPSAPSNLTAVQARPRFEASSVSVNQLEHPDPTDLSPVTEEVAEILSQWEAASRDRKTVKLNLVRTCYNLVFQVERLADVEMFYEAPGNLKLCMKGSTAVPQDRGARVVNPRLTKDGVPFRIEPDRDQAFIFSPRKLVIINDDDKTYEILKIPSGRLVDQVTNVLSASTEDHSTQQRQELDRLFEMAVPILFGFRQGVAAEQCVMELLIGTGSDQIRQDWSVRLLNRRNEQVILALTPRTSGLKQVFKECWIMIDTSTWQSTAIKQFLTYGSPEVVYKINDRQINPRLPADCFTPDLKAAGYKSLLE